MEKVFGSPAEALEGLLHDGIFIAASGFGLCGFPEQLADTVEHTGRKDQTLAPDNTGVGTVVTKDKKPKDFNGKTDIFEEGLFADLAIVKAWKADATGKLVFGRTARSFTRSAAMCRKNGMVGVEESIRTGAVGPDLIHATEMYVHRIIQDTHEKRIEQRATRAA